MKGRKLMSIITSAALLAGAAGALPVGAAEAEQPERIPLIARYDSPAASWEEEATPLGNGFIGAMVFGGVENDRIQINEHTLWSGGPGANQNFDGGNASTPERAHAALKEVRELLQQQMTEFTQTKGAKLVNGRVVANNYPDNHEESQNPNRDDVSKRIGQLMTQLKGEKNYFGSYQTLGNILLSDPAYAVASIATATSSEEPSDSSGEVAANLFDGSNGTKWFAGNSGKTVSWPVTVDWSYTAPVQMSSYTLTSANDMSGRDPYEFILYGSEDGVEYKQIDQQKLVSFPGRQTDKVFTLRRAVTYTYYRLSITKTRENLPPQLAEIALHNSAAVATQKYENYNRQLDLDNAVAKVSYDVDGITYTREYFVSNPGNVMAIRLTASEPGKVSRLINLTSEQQRRTVTVGEDTIRMVGQPNDQRPKGFDGALHFAQMLKVVPTGGTMTSNAGGILVKDADEVLILMSAGTNYQQCTDNTFNYFTGEDPMPAVEERVNTAAAKSWDDLLGAHTADYKELFDRVQLNLGYTSMPTITTKRLLDRYKQNGANANDSRYLETLYYQFGRYLLIASSREGSLPANLQGIWAEGMSPPWSADYHTNINVQMNYWLAEQTNLSECHMPVIDYVNAQVPRGYITAQVYHCTEEGDDVRGWTLYHENNIWGNTMPATSGAFYCPTGGAWVCQDIWEHYAFTRDEEFLRDNFDTLLGAAIFWVDNLWTDTRDGTLVSGPSYSPEHGSYSLGCSFDQEVIWEIFTEVIKAAEVLDPQDEGVKAQIEEIKAAKEKLWMPAIGLSGKFLEWKDETNQDITGDGGHRHVNHLYGLHPGSYVVAGRSDWDDERVAAMKSVLVTRGDGGTGWSKAWKINFWARLRDGDHAETMVTQILKESTYANLFDTHPPFQIDGNFGATAGMTEMLLQSQGASIDLLAALPKAWASGSVSGLKARGNFTVDMEWADGKLTGAAVTSVVGGECPIRFEGVEEARVLNARGEAVELTANGDGSVSFDTQAGETYRVTFGREPEPVLLGDVDGDGDVTSTDARLTLQLSVDKITESDLTVPAAADVDGDGKVTSTDARLILQKSVGKIDKFPAEE